MCVAKNTIQISTAFWKKKKEKVSLPINNNYMNE